jgi:hypothetical protein
MTRSLRVQLLAVALLLALAGLAASALGGRAQAQAGPTVTIQGPANGATVANPVQMHVTSTGATIKPATAGDPNAAHYHYFIDRDPATVLQQGQPIPTGQPDIIHTDDANLMLPTLTAGPHRVWVVLAHTDHTPFSPNVQAQVTFTVSAAAATPAAGGAATPAANAAPRVGTGGLLAENRRQSLLVSPLIIAAILSAAVAAVFFGAIRKSRSER